MGNEEDLQELELEEVELPETEPESDPEPVKTKAKQKSAPTDKGDSTNWKAKYDGLKGYATQQRADADRYKKLYSEAIADQEAASADKDARIEELEARVAELQGERDALSHERDTLSKKQNIAKTIRQKHPDLLELYEEGLLRVDDLDDEALDQYLENLANKLDGKVGTALRDTLRGAAPRRPSGQTANKTAAELMDDLMQLDPRSEEYQKVFEAYDKALRAEDAS